MYVAWKLAGVTFSALVHASQHCISRRELVASITRRSTSFGCYGNRESSHSAFNYSAIFWMRDG
jgi:hypothetical protein